MSDDWELLNEKEQAFVDAYSEKIREEERERISALLGDDAEIWHSENLQADLIALIKGEN